MKENIQRLFDALSDADDIYNQIPFTSDESMSLKCAIARAMILTRKLNSDPQTGESLNEFCSNTKRIR